MWEFSYLFLILEKVFSIYVYFIRLSIVYFGVSKSLILMPVSLSGTAAESCEIKTMTVYVEKFDFRDGVKKDSFMVIIC